MEGNTEAGAFEVPGSEVVYPGAQAAADFPDGPSGACFAVSQWGDGWGWGLEAEARFA